MDLERLLLSGSGRIGRGAFWGGLIAIAVYAVAVAAVFRVPEGAFCGMDPQSVLGRVYFAALAILVLLGAVMLLAIGAKRLSDMGWPEWLAVLPALAVIAAVLSLRLDALGACGVLGGARLGICGGAVVLVGLFIVLGGLWPGRRPRGKAKDELDDDQAVPSER